MGSLSIKLIMRVTSRAFGLGSRTLRFFGSGLTLAVMFGTPRSARADLAAPFVGKVVVDSAYVTGAPSATDIAFSADGRAIVTTKAAKS